jgi:glycosyltransferase involved in cell wall biosynthesis
MVMKRHVLFIVENASAPEDTRVWNEAIAMKHYGYDVSIISPNKKGLAKKYEKLDGVEIYRHPMPFEASKKFTFILEYVNALFWEFLLCLKIFIKKPFHFIHSANPPDNIFLIAFLFKIFKVRYIFDHHDITPENYLAKFSRKDLFYRLLLLCEKLTFKSADAVISTNESYKNLAIKRGGREKNEVFVVRNGPNLSKVEFLPENKKLKCGFEYLVAYVGVMGSQEGIENLLSIANHIVYEKNITDIKFILIGTGPHLKVLKRLTKEMRLDKYVHFTGYIPYRDFYEILSTADACVNPEHRNEFTDCSTMLKIMDYMVMGKPIVMFETTEGRVTAKDSALYIKENNDIIFAESLIDLLHNKKRRKAMGIYGKLRIFEKLNWDLQKENLIKAYQYLEQN